MNKRYFKNLLYLGLASLLFLAAGCSSPATDPTPESSASAAPAPEATASTAPTATEPTKEGAEETLRKFAQALEAKDYETAIPLLVVPEKMKPETIPGELEKMVERQEISSDGVEILITGKYGPAAEVFPERAADWAERAKVELDSCYAFSKEPGEAVLAWGEGGFRLIRFDDIAKLK